ncbi:acylphosphatase [Kitasatospora sp. NPDC002227]|uniref:acylphosphatase n=1 Tax=Kitasatospora sp. NPDC002227 TaxID=3154773 RepID=UPI00332128AD
MHAHDPHQPTRVTAWVRGRVQQVGFRWWTRARALEIGLTGYASNLGDGRVQVVAEGTHADCERLLALLRGPGTPGAVSGVTEIWTATGGGYEGFAIR